MALSIRVIPSTQCLLRGMLFILLQSTLLLCSYYYFESSRLGSSFATTSGSAESVYSLREKLGQKESEIKLLKSQVHDARSLLREWSSRGDVVRSGEAVDLLDDRYILEGFPKEPLTITSARLCDEKWTIMLQGSWRCPSDPTCAKCQQSSIRRFRTLLHAFRGPGQEQARIERVREHFGSPEHANTSMIAIMAVNYGQLYLFLNWACSCERLGIDPKVVAMVVPTDKQTAHVLQRLGFFFVSPDWIAALDQPISARYSGAANSGGHAAINNVVLLAACELVLAGYEVILHDVDIVWKNDVRPWLVSAGKRRDLLGMIAPYWNAKGVINSGFIYIRPTRMSKLLMKSLENLAPLKANSDQELWNIVIRHLYLRQISFRILPQAIFYKYSGSREKPPTNVTRIYHAVGASKRSHMRFHKVWYFGSSCAYYDNGADEISQKVNEDKKWQRILGPR